MVSDAGAVASSVRTRGKRRLKAAHLVERGGRGALTWSAHTRNLPRWPPRRARTTGQTPASNQGLPTASRAQQAEMVRAHIANLKTLIAGAPENEDIHRWLVWAACAANRLDPSKDRLK